MNKPATKERKSEVVEFRKEQASFSLVPKSLDEAMQFAAIVSKSEMVPADYRGKPENCLIAMQMGMELGIPPLQSLQNIAVVNGRPCIWGDLLPALARAHPEFEYMNEEFDSQTMTATCTVKRRNQPEQIREFSQQDATTAGLWGRNTWKNYPKRMLQMRARGFAIRDVFPDALKGVSVAEDIIDLDPKDYSTANSSSRAPTEFKPLTEEQVNSIEAFISENELPKEELIAYFGKAFGVSAIDEIPADKFNKTMSILQEALNRRAAKQEKESESE